MRGTIKKICEQKGFGFLRPDKDTGDLFFHISQLVGLEFDEALIERDVLFDEVLDSRSGKMRPVNVRSAR